MARGQGGGAGGQRRAGPPGNGGGQRRGNGGNRSGQAGGAQRSSGATTARTGQSASVGRGRSEASPGRTRAGGRVQDGDGIGGEQVEGRQAVRELLRAGRRQVRQLLVAEGSEQSDALEEIFALAADARIAVRRVDRSQIDAAAMTEAPQGVLARADPIQSTPLDVLLRPGEAKPFLLVLDGVTDPHNLGAVMRSALCAGATGLVIARHRSAHLTPSAVKSAAGAVEHLPVSVVAGIPAALAEMAESGVWTVGLDSDATESLWAVQVATEPVALVLGAEGRGLSRLARQRCEVAVAIPTYGPLGSLNVSAAAALACFEVARRRA